MFCPLEYRDSILILRGIVVLVVAIILGISVTQQQLNDLTQRQEYIGTLTIPYDQGGHYSMSLFGSSYDVKAVYSVGKISNGDKAIFIEIMDYNMEIPTYIEVDCKRELILLDLWAKLLVEEAFSCKQAAGLYLEMIHEKINVYTRQFR